MWPGRGERERIERIVELVITREREEQRRRKQERKNSEKNGGRGNTLGLRMPVWTCVLRAWRLAGALKYNSRQPYVLSARGNGNDFFWQVGTSFASS